jgi:transposase
MEANNIIPHFMPPYTPEFNCIEALWGWVKKDVKKRMAQSQIVKKTLK